MLHIVMANDDAARIQSILRCDAYKSVNYN